MNALHLIRARDAAFVRRERTLGVLLLSAMPGPLLVLLFPFWAATMHGPLAGEFCMCLLACALWPVLAAEVASKAAPRMRIVGAALALSACGAPPTLPVPRAPSIPTTDHETWRCASPGAPTVLVEGTPVPARVEVDGVALDCGLVPLGNP